MRTGPWNLHFWIAEHGASPGLEVSKLLKRPGPEGVEPGQHSLITRKSINDRPKPLTYGQDYRRKRVWEAPFASSSDKIVQGMPCDGKR
jgi:hypothetical protein